DGAGLRRLRRRIGMIFQQFNLAKRLSVLDNVLAGGLGYQPALRGTLRIFNQDERRRALANLKRVGLLDHAYKRADELTREYADRVIGLRRGRIVFDGPTAELSAAAVDAVYHHED